jgi:hypothetical protein
MQWQGMLLHYIGGPLNVKLVYTRADYEKKWRTRWTLIGTPDNIKAVQILWEALVPWLKSQAAMERRLHVPRNPNAFNRAFFDQAGFVIHQRLQEQRDNLAHSHTKGTDLVLARDAQNQRYADNLFGGLRKSRGRGYGNLGGQVAGHQAGHRADINPGRKISDRP